MHRADCWNIRSTRGNGPQHVRPVAVRMHHVGTSSSIQLRKLRYFPEILATSELEYGDAHPCGPQHFDKWLTLRRGADRRDHVNVMVHQEDALAKIRYRRKVV